MREYTMSGDEVCCMLRGVRSALGSLYIVYYLLCSQVALAYKTTQRNENLITVDKSCPTLRGEMSKLLQ